MNSDPNHHEHQLIDALLQEQARNDREQEILAIEAAFIKQTITKTQGKPKHRRAWIAGIAACAALSAGLYHQRFSRSDIVAKHDVQVPSKMLEESHSFRGMEEAVEEELKSLPLVPESSTASKLEVSKQIVYANPQPALQKLKPDASATLQPPAPASPLSSPQPQSEGKMNESAAVLSKDIAIFRTRSGGLGTERGQNNSALPSTDALPVVGAIFKNSRGEIGDGGGGGGFGRDSRFDKSHVPADADRRVQAEHYATTIDPGWKNPREDALSTFSVDVDNASYTNIRRMIEERRGVAPDAVRIEECINAFDYGYAAPTNDDAFAVHQSLSTCPWNEKNALLRIGIKGKEIPQNQRPASNLVFLIDVSGSMQTPNKLPLVKESLKLLLGRLDERDRVSYVVYAGSEGVVLPPTTLNDEGRAKAIKALDRLEAGGSTNGGAGIKRAYAVAAEQFLQGGTNRVILCSDGDFNVGVTGTSELVSLVKTKASTNIYLSVLSFGTGNLNDEMLESIARDGNGNHYYIDGLNEARNVFLKKLSGTLITIAKDVKLQLEFNPSRVASYRLIGYANRQLSNQDFHDDRVDAGDIGAGHEVTAFYEIIPSGAATDTATPVLKYQAQPEVKAPAAPVGEHAHEWLTLKLRHKHPEGDKSALQEHALRGDVQALAQADKDFRFATAVAMFGMKLRHDSNLGSVVNWDTIRQLATDGLGSEPDEAKTAFLDLLRKLPQ
jgi:secreted protein with Ig-like and vWFA domain